MRLIFQLFMLLFLLTFCVSCKNEVKKPDNPTDVPAMVVTNTPEGVLRAYQELIDNNRFDEAKRLSTQSGQKFLEQLRILSTADTGDQPLETDRTVFNKINCRQGVDKAVCTYEIITEGENIPDSISLVYQNEKWLIDIPEENFLMEVDSLELMMKEMDTKKKK
jgi:hypothetical protein